METKIFSLHNILFEVYLNKTKETYWNEKKKELEPIYGDRWESICSNQWKEYEIKYARKDFDFQDSSNYYNRFYGFMRGIYCYIHGINTKVAKTIKNEKKLNNKIKINNIDYITRIYIITIMNLDTTRSTSFFSKVKTLNFDKISINDKINFFNKFINKLYLCSPITEDNREIFEYARNNFSNKNFTNDEIITKWNTLIQQQKESFNNSINTERNKNKFLNQFNDETKEKVQLCLQEEKVYNIFFPSHYLKNNYENSNTAISDCIKILYINDLERKKYDKDEIDKLISSLYTIIDKFINK